MSTRGRPESIDLSHHLSGVAKTRLPWPLKRLAKYVYPRADPVSWGFAVTTNSAVILQTLTSAFRVFTGIPHPSCSPFSAIHVDALASDSFAAITFEERQSSTIPWPWNTFGSKEKSVPFTVQKYPEHPGDVNLATALQYDDGQGSIKLREITKAFTERVYQPAYGDWEIFMDTGNMDA